MIVTRNLNYIYNCPRLGLSIHLVTFSRVICYVETCPPDVSLTSIMDATEEPLITINLNFTNTYTIHKDWIQLVYNFFFLLVLV